MRVGWRTQHTFLSMAICWLRLFCVATRRKSWTYPWNWPRIGLSFHACFVESPHHFEGPSNAQYASRFSARVLINWIDIWIERKLMCSLQESLYFSILADESLDISTKEQLSICGTWLVNGKPEDHFLRYFMSILQMLVLSEKLYSPSYSRSNLI